MTDPTKPGPDADRIAKLELRLDKLQTAGVATDWARDTAIANVEDELSRLRNEQPKGGDAIDREAEAAAARHEANKGKPWPSERLINELGAPHQRSYAAAASALLSRAADRSAPRAGDGRK